MSPLQKDMILMKVKRIIENLEDLQDVVRLGWEHYRKTRKTRKLAERCLQEAIEAASDINSHFLVEGGHGAPEDYFAGFIKSGEAKIIPETLAEKLAPCSGVRNRIVHEYDKLDHALIYKSIQNALALFPKYVSAIEKKLRKI